ncbi:3-hydroxybutyryl-CoA dehydrogenase [Oscillibacter sp. PC13]|uniref:3-hydroxyacyl-CoA dehydrogenase family protein n=1 Tax=Oscillibacter sp. PC13 TaxID=1855299 RepID=UPI0008E0B622|nr:3-hydroxyacyl-CoA dehydrogenase family protein [Oscillibacter sp. PC13]SFP50076.1 3-hydroxybutyryl-CoA dehydrogenase [Oscillibacter sp. PC13]
MKVAVFGAGTMGSGIAQVFAAKGHTVYLYASSPASAQTHKEKLEASLAKRVAKGKMTQEAVEELLKRILIEEEAACADADVMIECIKEDLEMKRSLFSRLEKMAKPEAILATNTSSLSLAEIAAGMEEPSRLVGIHFFNPVPAMKLVEIVRTRMVQPEIVSRAKEIVESLGKTTIMAPDSPGFVVNYLQYPFRLNAMRMLENGVATAEDIDTAAKLGLGHPMGPLELQDMVGLDVTYYATSSIYERTGDPAMKPPKILKDMVEAGLLGRKTGRGFYNYSEKK